MKDILETLFEGKSLTREQARAAMEQIFSGEVSPERTAALLGALRAKGESREELTGFAEALRSRCVAVPASSVDGWIDTCGTGGDGTQSFNISTAAAFVLAGAGVTVAKHGNRSISSRCGSADVLEALGIPIESDPARIVAGIEKTGFGFFFAPHFHPAMKQVAPIRKALGIKTVFNLLGPLCNPALVRRQIIGVFDSNLLEPIARVLGDLGCVEAMVVRGEDGMDEITLAGETRVAHLRNGEVRLYTVTPETLGLTRAHHLDLAGGDAQDNARIIESILAGEKGPRRNAVLVNAAAGFVVAGRATDLNEGIRLAMMSIDSGRASEVLYRLRESGRS